MSRTFGNELRKIRESLDLTQTDIATMLGINTVSVSRMESNAKPPPGPETISKLLAELKSTDKLVDVLALAARANGYVTIPISHLSDAAIRSVAEFGLLAARGFTESQWTALLTLVREA